MGSIIPREALHDHYIGDIFVKKGTYVDANICAVMRSETHWEKPEEFLPSRWLENNNSKKEDAYTYTPFHSGARNCNKIKNLTLN